MWWGSRSKGTGSAIGSGGGGGGSSSHSNEEEFQQLQHQQRTLSASSSGASRKPSRLRRNSNNTNNNKSRNRSTSRTNSNNNNNSSSNHNNSTHNNNAVSSSTPGRFSRPNSRTASSSSHRKRRLGGGGRQPHQQQQQQNHGGRAASSSLDRSRTRSNHSKDAHAGAAAGMTLAETVSGIEVTFSGENDVDSTIGTNSKSGAKTVASKHQPQQQQQQQQHIWKPVVSTRDQLAERQKFYQAQFNVEKWSHHYPIRTDQEDADPHYRRPDNHNPIDAARISTSPHHSSRANSLTREPAPRKHRIPLQHTQPATTATPKLKDAHQQALFDDILFLLRSHEVADEATCVRDELALMDAEIEALEEDRLDLERRALFLQSHSTNTTSNHASSADHMSETAASTNSHGNATWDIYQLLSNKTLASHQRLQLQEARGLFLTVHLHNPRALEQFLTKCGCKPYYIKQVVSNQQQQLNYATIINSTVATGSGTYITASTGSNKSSSISSVTSGMTQAHIITGSFHHQFPSFTIRPDNCRDSGAAATIQHLALLNSSAPSSEIGMTTATAAAANAASFWMSRDFGKSYYWGRLPDRLFRRMRESGIDPHKYANEIVYLSTGPLESYYVEFRSGECWWGSAGNDEEFHLICTEWNVYRVVFGACCCETILDCNGSSPPSNSSASMPSSSQSLSSSTGKQVVTTSWIILGRDGRVAWKNVPARLHHRLESRLASQAAPAEVALGYGDAYFIRFVDGSTDYSLPAHTAEAVKQHQIGTTGGGVAGSAVTAVYLHPECPHDYVIRHR